MNSKLANFKMECDFCGERTAFKDIEQVPLKIDKSSKSQHLFANQCAVCKSKNIKVTLDKQKIRSFTGRHRAKNESSIFDAPDGD